MSEIQITLPEGEVLRKSEFIKAFQQVLDLVKQILDKTGQSHAELNQKSSAIISKMQSDNSMTLADMRKSVDKLFVGQKLDAMMKEHQDMMAEMKKMHAMADTKVKGLKGGKDGAPGLRGPAGSPDLPEQIVNKLESLKGENRLDVSAIKGLDKLEKRLGKMETRTIAGGGSPQYKIIDIDLSSQFNGVLKTFNIQAIWNVISVSLSSYPYGTLRKNIDYTFTNTTLTFGDSISASEQLAAGQACVLTVVLP